MKTFLLTFACVLLFLAAICQNTQYGTGATITGTHNSLFGYQTAFVNTLSGSYNSILGSQAGYRISSGVNNTAIGYQALYSNTTTSNNVALGYQNGYTSTGSNYVGLGSKAGYYVASGDNNTFLGYASARGVSGSSNNSSNTLVGAYTGYGLTTGSNNSALGYLSGYGLTTGANNILIGSEAGTNITTGSNNIIIGIGITAPTATGSNLMILGSPYLLSGDLTNNRVGIGTTAPISKLTIVEPSFNAVEAFSNNGNSAIVGTSTYAGDNNYTAGVEGYSFDGELTNYGIYGYVESEYNTSGTLNYGVYGYAALTEGGTDWGGYFMGDEYGIEASGNIYAGLFNGDVYATGTVYSNSDRKFKDNINDIPNALDLILKLEPREFTFKNSPEYKRFNLPKGKNFGFIAQELEPVIPELVTDVNRPRQIDKKGKLIYESFSCKAVNYISLIPFLTQAIKEQQVIINDQSRKIEEMETEINNIKRQLGLKGMLNDAILSPVMNNQSLKQTALFQNNPNPFSFETSIDYNIAEKFGKASLCVYNLQGTQLKKYDIQSNGQGKITIHANEFVAGIYLYTLLVDNKEIATKRMILTQ